MGKATLLVEEKPDGRGQVGRRSVGGGKDVATAKKNAAKVFARDKSIKSIIVSELDKEGRAKDVETIERGKAEERPAGAGTPNPTA